MSNWRRRVLQSLLLFGLVFSIGIHWWSSPVILFESLNQRGYVLVAIGITGFYLIRPFVLWPLSIASIFLRYKFGFPSGVALVLAGTVVTCTPPFIFAGCFHNINSHVSQFSETAEEIVTEMGEIRGMITARLSPAPADGVSIGAGLAGVSNWNFTIGTLIGELPWAIFYVTVGQSLQSFSSGSIQTVNIDFLIIASLAAVLLLAQPFHRFLIQKE